ncbi:hypothetical protein [Corynebacterium heidelbergense]|uniref:hypothetical protein n=1 Tax=Corynebacterium heidelbergense TaxID=2055947 RepID=UPI001057816D|nr:hypothetical protein [Corynebacterium heidelbergense]
MAASIAGVTGFSLMGVSLAFILFPKATPHVAEVVKSSENALIIESYWLLRVRLLSIELLMIPGSLMYFVPLLQLNRGPLFQIYASIAGVTAGVGFAMFWYRYRPAIYRFEFREDKVIFDMGNREAFCVLVEFDDVRIKTRWHSDIIRFDGCKTVQKKSKLLSGKTSTETGRGHNVEIPNSKDIARAWRPALSAVAMGKVREFYASHQLGDL